MSHKPDPEDGDEFGEELSPTPSTLSTTTRHYAPDKPVTYGLDRHGVLWVDVFEVKRILGLDGLDISASGPTSLHPDDLRTFEVIGTDWDAVTDAVLTHLTTLSGLFLLVAQSDTRPADSVFIAWVTYVLIPSAHGTAPRTRS